MIVMKNWSSYQSYKDRKPPWIRLHKSLLDNYEFQMMSADARALLPMLWLLASEHADPISGKIEYGMEQISFRLRISIKTLEAAVSEICEAEFCESNHGRNETVTKPYQNRISTVTPETETETETENIAHGQDRKNGEEKGEVYTSRKGKKLSGKTLSDFLTFWETFGLPKGKAEAADAWMAVYSPGAFEKIISAAKAECDNRPALVRRGQTPKYAQGWLNGRRWEDEIGGNVQGGGEWEQ